MTITDRAKIIPDEAKTSHLILDDKWDGHFVPQDLIDAYISGANDVRTLVVNEIFKCKTSCIAAEKAIDKILEMLTEI